MRSSSFKLSILSVAIVLLAMGTMKATAGTPVPEAFGRFKVVGPQTVSIPMRYDYRLTSGNRSLSTDVYVPDARGKRPLLLFWHGECRSKAEFAHWGQLMASHGFISILPTSRSLSTDSTCQDGVRRVDWLDMLDVYRWAKRHSAVAGSLLENADLQRVGVIARGYSAIEASRAVRFKDHARTIQEYVPIRVLVLLDFPDSRMPTQGSDSLGSAAPYRCGEERSWRTLETLILSSAENDQPSKDDPSTWGVDESASACNPREVFRYGHALVKGGLALTVVGTTRDEVTKPSADKLFQRYTSAFVRARLGCEQTLGTYLNGEAALEDEQQGLIDIWEVSDPRTDRPGWC